MRFSPGSQPTLTSDTVLQDVKIGTLQHLRDVVIEFAAGLRKQMRLRPLTHALRTRGGPKWTKPGPEPREARAWLPLPLETRCRRQRSGPGT